MVAFELFGWPIYWYGIFYLITFVVGYIFLWWAGNQAFLSNYPKLQHILQEKRDDLMLVILLGVIVGGRLGHIIFYEPFYYFQHPLEIIAVWEGGMAFVGGVLGVVISVLLFARWHRLPSKAYFLLGDLILCIVPLGSLLGRIGNYLNQELRGLPVEALTPFWQETFQSLGLTSIYPAVDQLVRVNTNFIQSALEGGVLLIVCWTILLGWWRKEKVQPGLIVGVFLIGYGIVRFFVEFFKDIPAYEQRGILTVSQWLMLVFVAGGVWIISTLQKRKKRK